MADRIGAAAVTLVALFTCAAAAAPPLLPPGPATVLRVAQAGYAVGTAKTAYFMGPSAAFTVTDDAGATVLTGTTGPDRGRWNAAYPSVRPIDLSSVDTPGRYHLAVPGVAPVGFAVESDVAAPLVASMTGFLRSQRDGSHGLDRRAQVYEFAGLDASPSYVDASGGWFDAGDYLKLTATTSYALVCLQVADRVAGPDPARTAEIEHGLDWLRRMWDPARAVLQAQVGLGDGTAGLAGDHDVWRLPQTDDARTGPERLLANRPVFAANRPGEPVSRNLAGRTAAAFALAARRYSDTEPTQAREDLDRAAAVYAAAGGDRLVTAFPADYYPETSGADDLELAAAELFHAGEALDDPRAGQWHADARRLAARWPDDAADEPTLHLYDTTALAHLELGDDDLVADVGRRLDVARDKAAADPFGAGAYYTEGDATARMFGTAATAALYAGVTGDPDAVDDAWAQVQWVLGVNAWGTSFVVGAGAVYPRCPQHPVANLTGTAPAGAVVAGPAAVADFADLATPDGAKPCHAGAFERFTGRGARYVDDVAAWPSVEPTLDATATAILALALLTR
ncbi:hydrolase [Virgisporangium aurantiacum]|uniref:Hydrolase n=1 Tax=Virgisporangium aurantiacum TaxID=175570 RepID=A0A8J4E8C0_9ACTN|nr:hydrolase [Virgisporangium aurantiacum]